LSPFYLFFITVSSQMKLSSIAAALSLGLLSGAVNAEIIHTKVAILGGGVSGISAALNLTLNGMHDFVLVEARDVLGGKLAPKKHTHS
jgi:polyamine oxidase